MSRLVEIDRFNVRSAAGEEFEIIAFQEYVPSISRQDPNAEMTGMKMYFTSNADTVQLLDSGSYYIADLNLIVHKF